MSCLTKMWSSSLEHLLQTYGDECQTRESLHRAAYDKYTSRSTCFALPVIILSALSGSLSFASKGYPEIEEVMLTSTAGISILVSVISAVSSYLKYGERKSHHQIAMDGWQGLLNNIKHVLGLQRDQRPAPDEFALEIKTAYDRLYEISPPLEQSLITLTKTKIARAARPGFAIPSYLNGWHRTRVWTEPEDSYEDNSDNEERAAPIRPDPRIAQDQPPQIRVQLP